MSDPFREAMIDLGIEREMKNLRWEIAMSDLTGQILNLTKAYEVQVRETHPLLPDATVGVMVGAYHQVVWDMVMSKAKTCETCGKSRPDGFEGCKRVDCPYRRGATS